ncbi:hypothetical protein [uncultured Arenimonas sp.]|uniref:hypothetical protein n=1 Tax=uncultured Arenimonas sp. TaxID=546226 RepID=UPI0030DC355B
MTAQARRIAARLDRLALDQLRAEAARLAEENERLWAELQRAESAAGFWQDNALAMQRDLEDAGVPVGLTADGQVGAVERLCGGSTASDYYDAETARVGAK